MRISVRGPLGWALAAGLLIAACGGTTPQASGGPSAAASSGPRIGSFNRPVVLSFTPSQEGAVIATSGNAIKAALERARGRPWKVTPITRYAARVEAICAGSVDGGGAGPRQTMVRTGRGW